MSMADAYHSAAPVLLCRQSAERSLGLSLARQGRIILVTSQGDGVVSYDTARLVTSSTKALGSSQAQLLAPVQQLDGSYVAALQPHGSPQCLLVRTSASSKQQRPLLDAEQQLPLPSALHSLHVLTSSSSNRVGCAAVVLADGTVGAADFEELVIRQCSSSSSGGSSTTSGRSREGHRNALAASDNGHLLAVAKQSPTAAEVTIDVYEVVADSSSSSDMVVNDAAAVPTGRLQLSYTCSVACPSSGSKLANISLSTSLLAVQWNDGSTTVHHGNLSHRNGKADHVAHFPLPAALQASAAAATASQQSSRKRRAADEATSTDQQLFAVLSDTHLLLLAVHSAREAQYAVLDSRYGCCVASGKLSLDTPAASDVADNKLQLLPLPQQSGAAAALLVAGGVFLLHMQLPKADLAGLVSKLALGSSLAATQPAAAAAVVTTKQQISLMSIAAAVSTAAAAAPPQQQSRVLQQVPALQEPQQATAAVGQAGQVAAAAQQLSAVVEQQPVPAAELKQVAGQLCSALQQQQQQQQHAGRRGRQQQQQRDGEPQQQQQLPMSVAATLVSQRLLGRGLAALAEAKEWQLIEQLHSLQPLQSLLPCQGLLQALAADHQYALLRQVVGTAQDVPGDMLVQAVQQLLSQPTAEEAAARQQEAAAMRSVAEAVVTAAEAAVNAGNAAAAAALLPMARCAAAAVDGFTSSEMLLHVLLAAPVDGVEVQAALTALPTPTVLRLLKALHKWAVKYSSLSLRESATYTSWEAAGLKGEQFSSSAAQALLQTPSWAQVLEWTKLVLDAHLTRLAMLPAAGQLLRHMQAVLQPEVGATNGLVRCKGVVDHMLAGGPLPAVAEAANSEYTLELLDLRVGGK